MNSITLPNEFTKSHVGFTLDAGGSVIKVLYRPKESKQKNEHKSDLRMAFIDTNNIDELLDFISDNCDLLFPEGDSPEVYFTGVRLPQIQETLSEKFKIRVKVISEFDACTNALLYMSKSMAATNIHHRIKQVTMETVLKKAEIIYKTYADKNNPMVQNNVAASKTKMKLYSTMTNEELVGATTLANNREISWPALVAVVGSAFCSILVQENGTYNLATAHSRCGKTLLGLGNIILGTRDFDEILELASKGDLLKVHTRSEDLKVKVLTEDDHYSRIPNFFTVFSFGKLHDSQYDGSYSREDLAAALVNHIVMDIVQVIELTLQCNKNVKTVILTGSFFEHELIRDMFYDEWLTKLIFKPELQDTCLKIMRHSGHIAALGCWMKYFTNKE